MRNFKVLISAILLFVSTIMPGQNLPSLQKDGSISTGELQNGISYYLVSNPKFKGVADFALVMRGRPDTMTVRKELSYLPHFNHTSPYKFLSRKGIGCRPEGYISYQEQATLYRFEDVPVIDQASSDSTLLLMFDIIDSQPYQYAIVISGDINVQTLVNRMTVFSMSIPKRDPSYTKAKYSWLPSDAMSFSFTPSDRSSVTLDIRSPRTPEALMNTIQPFLTQMYVDELKYIIYGRLEETFSARSIPVRNISIDYVNSSMTSGDEQFKVRIDTRRDQQTQTTIALASVIAEIAANGVSKTEYLAARVATEKDFLKAEDNSDMVEKCIASYLYGADLARDSTKVSYIHSRNLNDDAELKYFNNFAKAFLNVPENFHVSWMGDEDDPDEWTRTTAFSCTWNAVSSIGDLQYQWLVNEGDTTLLEKEKGRSKFKSSSSDVFTGGTVMNYSNGMKVIYKNMSSDQGRFSFSLLIRDGFSSVKKLAKGEGAFFSDMLWLNDIAGMRGTDFIRLLNSCGVKMQCRVTLSDMRIYGSAPSSRLKLVMKSLLSVANERTPNQQAFENYKKMELARLKPAVLDSLMYQDYEYSEAKTVSGLVNELFNDSNAYFDKEFMKVNDGVLIIAGDISESKVQKTMEGYLGAFRTSRVMSNRPAIQYKFRKGDATYSSEGKVKKLDIGIVASLPLTVENNMAFLISCMQMRTALAGTMAECGYSVRMTPAVKLYPTECAEVVFNCTPVPEKGLPYGIDSGEKNPMRAVGWAKKTLNDILARPITDAELASYKTLLSNQYAAQLADPDNYVNSVLLRFAYGKDIISDYANRINNTSTERVNQIMKVLAEGMRVEYVVK